MPQWLNLPSIQKSYGAQTVAIRPLTRTSGFQIRSRIFCFDALRSAKYSSLENARTSGLPSRIRMA